MTSAFITRPQAQDYHRDARDIVSVDVISGLAIWGSAFLESLERFHAARARPGQLTVRKRPSGYIQNKMAPGRLTVMLLWLGAATASQRRKNKKKALAALKGRPTAMTLDARPLKYKDDAVGSYAKTWAAAHTNRSGVHFLERFGAIDVGCTYDVESSGAGDTLPRLVFRFADGSSTRAEPGWPDHFKTRPAVCEYARGPRESDAAMLLGSSSTDYLFRLWPLFLNKILYASAAKLRLFIWIGELPEAATRATAAGCYLSQPNRARFDQKPMIMHLPQRRLADSYTTDSYDIKDVTRVSNHHVKMPATLAVLAHPSIRGVYYVDLDSGQRPAPRDPARRAGPARGDLRLAKAGRGEHVLLRGEPGAHRR